jgi:AcrR family transcriptional regulator
MTRLSAERLSELYAGTLALVADHGFEKITMDQIAEATRSSKATLYRQWGSKVALVAEALRCTTAVAEEVPDTGSLRGDLHEMVARRARHLDHEADLVGAILHAVKSDETLRNAVREQIVSTLRERLDTVVGRAVGRGEISADNAALPYLHLLVITPFVLRMLVDDEPVQDAYLTDYLDAVVLTALGAPAA